MKKFICLFNACFLFNFVFSIFFFAESVFAAPPIAKLRGSKIAAVVYIQDNSNQTFQKSAQTHLEGILKDNGITVLDKEKADELKDVFPRLEDPGAFVTAETFIEKAETYNINGLLAIYLSTDIAQGVSRYYTATAQADIRFIDNEAKVDAKTNQPMGTPGNPPSDGLTRESAIINAIQRAIDKSCQKLGFRVLDPVRPKFIRVTLKKSNLRQVNNGKKRYKENSRSVWPLANLENQRWSKEEATCTAISPEGSLGAVAGYIKDTDFHRRPRRLFGSRVHLLDLQAKEEINIFDTHPVGKKERREKGTRKVLDVIFLSNWRFLAAVTGNELFLWETESGRLMSSVFLDGGIKDGELNFIQNMDKSYLVLDTKRRGQYVYELVF